MNRKHWDKLHWLDKFVFGLLLLGAFNWGLVGLFNFDLIVLFLGDMSGYTRLMYCIMGFASLTAPFFLFGKAPQEPKK